jgi:hypothetical protein
VPLGLPGAAAGVTVAYVRCGPTRDGPTLAEVRVPVPARRVPGGPNLAD